jgi:hypothetical protein
MDPVPNKSVAFRFRSTRLSEADFESLDRLRETIVEKARRTVDPEATGFDMKASDDGGFFPTGDDFDDWRDRYLEVILVASRRISLAVLSLGFAIAGASLMNGNNTSGYGQISLAAAGIFAIWTAAANIFGSRSGR